MSNLDPNQTAGQQITPAPTPSPTSGDVHKHLTLLQFLYIALAVIAALATALQTIYQAYPGLAWLPPTILVLSLIAPVVTAGIKAYNVPVILLVAVLCLGMGGCAIPTLPANPTQDQIAQAQNAITTDEAIFTAADAVLQEAIRTGKVKGQTQADLQLLSDKTWDLLEKAYDDAGKGKNINAHDLLQAVRDYERQVRQGHVDPPAGTTTPAATLPSSKITFP